MVSCVIGEVLWDVFPDGERFGGAALNFCANLQRLGDQATLLSAVGNDPQGQVALEQMRTLGVSTQGIRTVEDLPTGVARVSMNDQGEPSFAIPRPAAFDDVSVDAAMISTLQASAVDWIYFGTLLQMKRDHRAVHKKLEGAIASGTLPLRHQSAHRSLESRAGATTIAPGVHHKVEPSGSRDSLLPDQFEARIFRLGDLL